MTRTTARTTKRGIHRLLVVGLIAVAGLITAVIVYRAAGPSSPTARDSSGVVGEADGVLPDGITVFDRDAPAVTNLDRGLLDALRRAAADAGRNGIEFYVNSGWRSPEYQNRLLREAVAKYGSEAKAARWVATPDTSLHVSGDAVDIGRSDATTWLSEHGAAYGLCRIYKNEPWHYELRIDAIGHRCPAMYADPTEDPRLRQ